MVEAYPLQWPESWPRTASGRRERANFSERSTRASVGNHHPRLPVSIYKAVTELNNELRLLKAKSVVISSNLRVRLDGDPYRDQREPEDPGVAVYFVLDGVEKCMPIDRWSRAADNIRAIAKCIEAIRGMDRWGAKSFLDAAFSGFQALPPPDGYETGPGRTTVRIVRSIHEILGVNEAINDKSYLEYQYKNAAKRLHPDTGGSVEAFQELQESWEKFKRNNP